MMPLDQEFLDLTTDLDVDAFWEENPMCEAFTTAKPRCALAFSPDDHWLFEFLDTPSTIRYYHDKPYRDDLHRQANEITQRYVGKTFFDEDTFVHSPRRIENLFDCEFTYTEGGTPWLTAVTDDPDAFAVILDRAEAIDMATWALTDAFLLEWQARRAEGQTLPELGTGSRGPATIMTSVLHPETALFWMLDRPELMRRFRDILARKMIELNRALRAFSGVTAPGWWITDDNSALFNRALYGEFCAPVLAAVLGAMAPGDARRYQHSDSAMGHLLGEQSALDINSVNYGPEVDVAKIRSELPYALINGHIPPFLLRNGSPEAIRERVRSDFEKAGASGGLIVTTAGSLAAGTGVGRMRWLMKVVAEECHYQRTG